MTDRIEISIGPYIDRLMAHHGVSNMQRGTYTHDSFWTWLETEWHASRPVLMDTIYENTKISFPDEETALHFKLRWG